ncbi:hypothetical protein [Patulibacter sp. SYSU D01012]|uniref:hypothetical protein n=1 Tax=Patulibacter sp. SYSU D01012 TaxID=2817381 RepID=UPI001B316301|nr:hypothetical protein [Patulibacter sp. SYSU D01012]
MDAVRRPSPRVLLLAAAAVAALVAVLVLVTRGGDDDPRIRIVRGAPAGDFPLRGDLAGDAALIRSAAEDWIATDREDEDDDRRVFGRDDDDIEITALWAGRVGDERIVVLAHDRTAALLRSDGERDGQTHWTWRPATAPIDDAERPRIVPFRTGVLVPEDARVAFRGADARAPQLAQADGLWRARSDYGSAELPAGLLVLRSGLPPRRYERTVDPGLAGAVVVGDDGVAVRTLERRLAERLLDQVRTPVPALQRFVVAAGAPDPRERSSGIRAPEPERVELVVDRTLPRVGPTTVVALEARGLDARRGRVAGAVGGSDEAGTDLDETAPLPFPGTGDADDRPLDALRAPAGPAAAAVYVRRAADEGEPPVLLLAGDRRVRSFEVLAGTRRIVVDGPVAAVPATWVRLDRATPGRDVDVVIAGRTAGGDVVRPDGSAGRQTTLTRP